MAWVDGWWTSPDGLRLHFRDHGGDPARLPLLCIPGLTRNARDFEGLAARHAPNRRVIAVELRGRGESGCPKDPLSYVPATYLNDLSALLDALALPRIVCVGTSLGGLLAMLLAAGRPGQFAGVLLNDIGPQIEAAGLERIRGYLGRQTTWPTWLHAARALADLHGGAYPRFDVEDWLRFTKRLCRLNSAGRIAADYDVRLAEPFKLPPPDPAVDLWPVLDALAAVPATLLRGTLSDILTAETASRMKARLPRLDLVQIPEVGHAPTLDEPESIAALDRLLAAAEAELSRPV